MSQGKMRKNDKKGNCSGKRTKRSGEEGRERRAAGCNPPNTTAQTRERGKEGRAKQETRIGKRRGEREGKGGHGGGEMEHGGSWD